MKSDHTQIQAFLRKTAAADRELVRVGPFQAYFHPADPLKYLNYAVPDDGAEPTPVEVAALRDAFHRRDRLPRLEWLAEAAPAVAARLADAGLQQELETPLMAVAAGNLTDVEVPGAAVARATGRAAWEARNVQRVAFGDDPLEETAAEPPDARRNGGGTVVAPIGGVPAAAAGWTPVIDGVSEIVGVATAEPYRGRGLAGAVTAAAAREAFAEGAALCVLSPGSDAARRVYERAGFAGIATMLHWSG